MTPNPPLHPLVLAKILWPHITFYRQQKEIIESVLVNDETVVPAGNMLGKDFVAGFIALAFFLTRSPCRVVTTSVDYTQLEGVLWGEIRRFIQESKYPLDSRQGGPLLVNHLHLRKVNNGVVDGISYCIGRVAAKGEGMLGHHVAKTGDGIPRTLAIYDEASGVDNESYDRTDTWAERKLAIGNPYPCTNFFYFGVKAGNLPSEDGKRLYRKILKIKGDQSPNVRLAEAKIRAGLPPGDEIIIPGVLSYADYRKRRTTWDTVRQCIGLDAEFYEGAEVLLYPPDWLNKSEIVAKERGLIGRKAKTLGVDSAQAGDNTAFAVADEIGLMELISMKTPDTTVIVKKTISLIDYYKLNPRNVLFDGGGGGYQHACTLREKGYNVRIIMFGGAPTKPRKRTMTTFVERVEEDERRYVYKNRRCEMYGELRMRMDPSVNEEGATVFAIPAEYTELRRQLAPLPLLFDGEGRLYLPPKNKPKPDSKEPTISEMLGCSPDESDAVVLANFGMVKRARPVFAGVVPQR